MASAFLEKIAKRYERRGYQIYGLPPDHPDPPRHWEGPFPDLCVQKQTERIAFFEAFPQPCRALHTAKKLNKRVQPREGDAQEKSFLRALRNRVRAAVQNPGVEVCLFCSARECPYKPGATSCIFSRKITADIEIRRLLPASRPKAARPAPPALGLTLRQWRNLGLALLGGFLFVLFLQMVFLPIFLAQIASW